MKLLSNKSGFSLIEVIIVIVMISIAGIVMMTFMDTGITKSGDPLRILNDNITVIRGIEIVNGDYRAKLDNDPNQSMDFYIGDLSSKIDGLDSINITGQYTSFTAPDANRKVSEVLVNSASTYVRIEATQNRSRAMTLIGN